MMPLLCWSVWMLAVVGGFCLFMLRSTETGMAYVNLPRLLYFLWILVCVMVLGVMRAPAAAAALGALRKKTETGMPGQAKLENRRRDNDDSSEKR